MLKGNLFDAAIMKTSVISDDFRMRYLSDSADPEAFEARAVVFEGPKQYHATIDDPALSINERSILVVRGAGFIGDPGAAKLVNMHSPRCTDPGGHPRATVDRRRATIWDERQPLDPEHLA